MRTFVVATVSALALSSCGLSSIASDSSSSPSVSVQQSAGRGTDGRVPDDVYVRYIRESVPVDPLAKDQDIVNLGNNVCYAFDAGMSFNDVAVTLIDSGFNAGNAGRIIGASVGAFCPEHNGAIGME